MMPHIDLHIHSTYSNDGEFEVNEIVGMCVQNQATHFSITDHNTIKANQEAVYQCSENSITYIPGIEIDCIYQGVDMHLLGYQIDWQSNDFIQLEATFNQKVDDSLPEMIHNLNTLGFEVDEKEVLKSARGKLPSPELIAEVLLTNHQNNSDKKLLPYRQGGNRGDMPYINFYLDYFAQNKPAYVKVDYMGFKDAVELIKANNGIPIIAHPGLNFKGNEGLVAELLANGAEGLEVFNNYHNAKQMAYFAGVVTQGSFLMTAGSDFHGKTKPLITIGKYNTLENYVLYLKKSLAKLCKKSK